MDYNQVKDLINTINSSDILEFEINMDNAYIKMSKNNNSTTSKVKPNKNYVSKETNENSIVYESTIKTNEEIINIAKEKVEIKEGTVIFSPIVGTFYNSAAPTKPAYVKVGDKVKKGDVLCIVEAMKIMNEITSTVDGQIAEILIENEQLVEFNQPLFRIV